MGARSGRYVIGGAFIVVGLLYLAAAFSDFDATAVVREWWPVLLVALGVAQLAIDRAARLGSTGLIVVGLLLLGFTTGWAGGSLWAVLVPVIVVMIGVGMVLPRFVGTGELQGDGVDAFVVLRSKTITSRSQQFGGADMTVLFGHLTLDLTEARLAPGARIAVTVVLGGCEILVPQGWNVRTGGIPLLGGWDDTTSRNGLPVGAPELDVRVVAVLAGAEVRHMDRWEA